MNEAETRAEHIDPALQAAGWGALRGSRMRHAYPVKQGRLESIYHRKLSALDELKKSLLH